MGELGGLVEEDVLHHQAFQRPQRGLDVLDVGVGLGDVLTLDVKAPEAAIQRRLEHVGDAQAGFGVEAHVPGRFEQAARARVRHVAVARQLVREGAHVAGALHVVLAAQRIHPHAHAADVAGGHGEVGDRHHHGRALRMLGDAQAVVDGGIVALRGGAGACIRACIHCAPCIQPRRAAHRLGRHAGDRRRGLR